MIKDDLKKKKGLKDGTKEDKRERQEVRSKGKSQQGKGGSKDRRVKTGEERKSKMCFVCRLSLINLFFCVCALVASHAFRSFTSLRLSYREIVSHLLQVSRSFLSQGLSISREVCFMAVTETAVILCRRQTSPVNHISTQADVV